MSFGRIYVWHKWWRRKKQERGKRSNNNFRINILREYQQNVREEENGKRLLHFRSAKRCFCHTTLYNSEMRYKNNDLLYSKEKLIGYVFWTLLAVADVIHENFSLTIIGVTVNGSEMPKTYYGGILWFSL